MTEVGEVDRESDVMQDADAWQALDADDQDAILQEGLDDLKGERGEGHWRHLSAEAQQATRRAIERDDGDLSAAEEAMQAALDRSWTAECFADRDGQEAIPFECRELSEQEQDIMQDGFRMLVAIEQRVESMDDGDGLSIDDVPVDSEFFDSIDTFEDWLMAFLADVTVADTFDEERFRTGAGLLAGTRGELLEAIFIRYNEEAENARKFRSE